MQIWRVEVHEVWIQPVEVEAKTAEDAIRRVNDGDGTILDRRFEFSHTLDTDTWTVEVVNDVFSTLDDL